jgi:uncharacterized protein (DUF1501 family)
MTTASPHPPLREVSCGRSSHVNRRTLLKAAGLGGFSWLTPVAQRLARAAEQSRQPARSVIVVWLQGGPSQLETFDPHPGTDIAAGTEAIATAARGIVLAKGLEQLAREMQSVSIVRSVVSKEGDHERATYNVKTGFRPDPTLVHPSLGAIVCHQLPDDTEIPRHVSILPGAWPARGGYLGDQYDAFKVGDPQRRIPDVRSRVSPQRTAERIESLQVVEAEFARGRLKDLDQNKTLHRESVQSALKMMSSEQLKAFDVGQATAGLRAEYGDTRFGRGCLAAVQLIEAGVRCIEVTLGGWDSHLNNHEIQADRVSILDPALAAMIRDLKRRELFEQTVVVCGGEFGRTPRMNPTGGRDHWPHGFSIVLAGGGIQGGRVVGETSPDPIMDKDRRDQNVVNAKQVADIHATVLHALGINFREERITPIGRPMVVSEGEVIRELLA